MMHQPISLHNYTTYHRITGPPRPHAPPAHALPPTLGTSFAALRDMRGRDSPRLRRLQADLHLLSSVPKSQLANPQARVRCAVDERQRGADGPVRRRRLRFRRCRCLAGDIGTGFAVNSDESDFENTQLRIGREKVLELRQRKEQADARQQQRKQNRRDRREHCSERLKAKRRTERAQLTEGAKRAKPAVQEKSPEQRQFRRQHQTTLSQMGDPFRAQADRANELAQALETEPPPRGVHDVPGYTRVTMSTRRKRSPPRDSVASADKPMGGDPLASSPPLHQKRQRKSSARAVAAAEAAAKAKTARGKNKR
eukprot:COSAG01_NODE_1111_length_11656_cov_50.161028_1_plen_311_part_00